MQELIIEVISDSEVTIHEKTTGSIVINTDVKGLLELQQLINKVIKKKVKNGKII